MTTTVLTDKDFRTHITPIPDRRPHTGRGRWRVVVTRLSDGMTKTEKVSGEWKIAEHIAYRLQSELAA